MNKTTDYKDGPLEEVVAHANRNVMPLGGTIHQKWTCHHCNARQTMEQPNIFYRSGRCEECSKITIIDKCGYVAFL